MADRDTFDQNAKAERRQKLEDSLKERFHPLQCREIENLLRPQILRAVVSDYEGRQPEFPKFEHGDYAKKPLGIFIEEQLLKGSQDRKGRYADKSGTVTDKIGFCEKAIAATSEWSDLASEAQELTTKIYDFITANNR